MTSETTPIFQIKPARRQTVNCADDCPNMLCSQPYKVSLFSSYWNDLQIKSKI